MSLSPTDQLRLLNLAYNQMQADFKRILPDLFRGDAQSLTTDASGYIYLPANTFEVELLVLTSGSSPLDPISKSLKYVATGWYHDGMQTSGPGIGKRRIMIRNAGAAWTSLGVTVDALIEFPELTDLTAVPYPFVQQRYLNMLTELQTFMMHMEGGKESAGEAEKHWNAYQFLLGQVKKDSLSKLPEFISTAHSDAGDGFGRALISS
jgi:hypothetical protein